MTYQWPQDRDDFVRSNENMSDRDDRSDSLQYTTPDGYRRTNHVNYDKDLDWNRDPTPDSETRGGTQERARSMRQEEKHYRMERSGREDSPDSGQESLRSEPTPELRSNHRDRRSSSPHAHTVQNAPTYNPRGTSRRKMSTASIDSQNTDTSLPDVKQRSRSHSIDSNISINSRTRTRRLSFAEGRAYRQAVERAEEEANEQRKRQKMRERHRAYRQNRERVKNLDRKDGESDEEVDARDLRQGDVVLVNRGIGVVRYVGRLHIDTARSDYWAGVELKETRGKNDGSIKGRSYFKCKAGQGLFVAQVTKRIKPEELLEQLAIQRRKCKRVKKVVDRHRRSRYQNDVLRNQVDTMEHEIKKLSRNNIGNIASAVEIRMENFLNMLADSLNPNNDDYGQTSKSTLTVIDLPPMRTSDDRILGWLHRKKRNQKLAAHAHPHFADKTVRNAMVWLVRTLQKEVKDRRRQIDRRFESDRTRDIYSDDGSE